MTSGVPTGGPTPPRWLADEMLGRLARYLRFLGHDTAYVRGLTDTEVLRRAASEGRVLLTRDRELARRSPAALLLRSVTVTGQLGEVAAAYPGLPTRVTFDRCPECNAPLLLWNGPAAGAEWPEEIPQHLTREGVLIWQCPECSRHFWEGSHAAKIRVRISEALHAGAAV